MADLTDQQRQSYWRYNVTLTVILLLIWFVGDDPSHTQPPAPAR